MTMLVKDLPLSERPREKLISNGVQALSNAELLAILLRTGIKDVSVLRVAESILAICKDNGLYDLTQLSQQELAVVKGVGMAKAATILSAIELGRRVEQSVSRTSKVNTPSEAARYVMPYISHKKQEHFVILMLSAKSDVLGMKEISVGSLTCSIAHPREVFLPAIRASAASIIAVHNHPSGDTKPSKEDYIITRRLVEAGRILGIDVLDHIIVGRRSYFSMQEEGIIF